MSCTPRRVVSDREYNEALANRDNVNIIKNVLYQYREQLGYDDLHSCGLKALWRTLQYHDPSYGQKFTTSLHRFTHWEVCRELRRQKPRSASQVRIVPLLDNMEEDAALSVERGDEHADDLDHVRSRLSLLSDEDRVVIEQYYFEHLTMQQIGRCNGYSKETARQRLLRAVATLRQICQSGV